MYLSLLPFFLIGLFAFSDVESRELFLNFGG